MKNRNCNQFYQATRDADKRLEERINRMPYNPGNPTKKYKFKGDSSELIVRARENEKKLQCDWRFYR